MLPPRAQLVYKLDAAAWSIVLQDDCISACKIARLVIQLSTHLLSSYEPILKVVLLSREHSFYG